MIKVVNIFEFLYIKKLTAHYDTYYTKIRSTLQYLHKCFAVSCYGAYK